MALPGLFVLGAVFLTVTGAEALIADMGHFGRLPIQAQLAPRLCGPRWRFSMSGAGCAGLATARHRAVGEVSQCRLVLHYGARYLGAPLVFLATMYDHRQSSGHHRGIFAYATGAHSAGILPRLTIHELRGTRSGRSICPLSTGHCCGGARVGIRSKQLQWRSLWHSRHWHDGGDDLPHFHRRLARVALAWIMGQNCSCRSSPSISSSSVRISCV